MSPVDSATGPIGSRPWFPAAVAALLACAVFAVTLGGTYIYDDLATLRDDPRLAGPHRWGEFWTKAYFEGGSDNLYRPLTSMTYAVQWWVFGDRPWVFHLINVVLYAAGAAAVAELARRLAGTTTALLAGLMFAVHPLHVEPVANLVGRAELLCGLGIIGALILYMRRPLTSRRVAGIVACWLVAFLSKEQGLLLPLILLCWALVRPWWERAHPQSPVLETTAPPTSRDRQGAVVTQRDDRSLTVAPRELESHTTTSHPTSPLTPAERTATQYLVLAACWLTAGYITFRESILPWVWDRGRLDWTIQPLINSTGADRWLMPISLLGRYTALLLFPHKLSLDYGGLVIGSHTGPADPYLWLGLIALSAWVILFAWALRRRHATVVLCLIGLALTYGMIGNIVSLIGTNFGERLMYIPSTFFLILIALPMARLPARILIPLMVIALSAGAIRSVTYAAQWNDRLAFYQYSLRHQPNSMRLHLLVAYELMTEGRNVQGADLWAAESDPQSIPRLQQAQAVLAQARQLLPDYWDAWTYSGVAAMKLNKLDEARTYLNTAFQLALDSSRNPMHIDTILADLARRLRQRPATTPTTNSSTLPDQSVPDRPPTD